MKPCLDYHMHTPLCGHAYGEPREYVQKAIALGLSEIGFSDHAPFVGGALPGITMEPMQLPEYHAMIEDVKKTFTGQLTVKVGIEVDFIPGFEEKIESLLKGYPYDYVYGSVHFIDDWAFDSPDRVEREQWDNKDINHVYRRYYDLMCQCAQSGLFDIMSHIDLPKKYGHLPTDDLSPDIHRTAQIFRESGVVIEVNTAGLRKPIGEIYPSLDVLRIMAEYHVPIVFGSDAHTPDQVGMDFEKAFALAKEAGYREYVSFTQRKIDTTFPIN